MYTEKFFNPFARGARIVGFVLLGIFTAVIFGLLFGYFIKLLWNWLMPSVFHLEKISYWQAFGLVLLARLIFGTIGHHYGNERDINHHRRRCRQHSKWENHWSDDDWKIKGGWKDWQYYDNWWREEGKTAFENYLGKNADKDENRE